MYIQIKSLDHIVHKLNIPSGKKEWFSVRSFPRSVALVLSYVLQDILLEANSPCTMNDYETALANHSSDKLIYILHRFTYHEHIKDKIKNIRLKIKKDGTINKFVAYGNIVKPYM